MEGFGALQAQVREVMERHHPEVARWDRDMTADGADTATRGTPTGGGGGSSGVEDGVLPTLRAAEDTLLRAEARCARVDRLLTLQERYRADSAELARRVRALYEASAEEDATQTFERKQRMNEKAQAVFSGVKRLKDRVRRAQGAYQAAGISLAASGAAGPEEGLSELRGQVRKLAGRLHRLRFYVDEEQEERAREAALVGGEGGEGEEDDEAPPTQSAT